MEFMEQNWIKITDQLPAHKDLVIIKLENGMVLPSTYYSNQSFNGFYPFSNYYDTNIPNYYYNVIMENEFKNVIEWMLFPN